MPTAAHRECREPQCGAYALANGFCSRHQNYQRLLVGPRTAPNSARYQRRRRWYLQRHPVCAMCRNEFATILDHVVPHRGMGLLFWDENNWQGLCVRCHGVKTARETIHRD